MSHQEYKEVNDCRSHAAQSAKVMIFNPFDVWRLLHGKYVSKTTNKSRERQQKSSISILFPQNIHSPHIILFLTCGQSCGINLFCETIVTIAIYPRREEAAPLGLSCHNGHWIVTSHPPTLHYPSKHELNDDGSLYSFIQSGLDTSETNMTEDSWPERRGESEYKVAKEGGGQISHSRGVLPNSERKH